MGTAVTALPKQIYIEDVQFSTSVSESVANKIASAINYVIKNFDDYVFGIEGAVYSGLSAYPAIVGSTETLRTNCVISEISISNEISGVSGTTEFKIERQLAAGGSWTNIFSINCQIANTAADNIIFTMTGAAVTDVVLPVLATTTFSQNDKLRFTLITAAGSAENLEVHVLMRPT